MVADAATNANSATLRMVFRVVFMAAVPVWSSRVEPACHCDGYCDWSEGLDLLDPPLVALKPKRVLQNKGSNGVDRHHKNALICRHFAKCVIKTSIFNRITD